MNQEQKKMQRKWRRHCHIRKELIGTVERPRVNVFRSLKHLYCQVIDDSYIDKNGKRSGRTLVSCSSLSPVIREKIKSGGNLEAAKVIGLELAKLAQEKGIVKVAFDRGGYKYHGRIKALADAMREGGLKF